MESPECRRIPEPAIVPAYPNLPPDLARQFAALPPMPQRGRGRGRGRGRATIPASADPATRYTLLPSFQIGQSVRIFFESLKKKC